ncbi:putative plastid ribosomal protein L35 [Panicum miliaceum]|uniref:50S ribosomal protein L35 n=1 Tax=Panicum miliaceum TaxID=4540 RepID=A0A3L6S4L5_PANMI|nr:putative plastid ribosomal protein L35 [Panicum miliaceum]
MTYYTRHYKQPGSVCVAKASAKRFWVTGRGKIVRRCAGKQHLLGKKNTKRKKRLSKMVLSRIRMAGYFIL